MFFGKKDKAGELDELAILKEARRIIAPRVEDNSRRRFLMRSLTLGGVAML